jgi:metallo-beta-lactamase family protein
MKLTFLGAARTVTGSCYLLEINGKKLLIDCGMFQGPKAIKALNERPFAFAPSSIDAMILTHAHIDHSGLIPKLVKEGYKGPIHCTRSTQQLCTILLPDSAHIQESDAELANRKGLRAGRPEVRPLFTVDDAYTSLSNFYVHEFDTPFDVLPGVTAKLLVAGHILGSAIVELHVTEDGKKTKLIFTGDIGQPNYPILEDPEEISGADFIVTESTYGNRLHQKNDKEQELADIVNRTVERGGNVIIPAFAVGRTQVLLYYFQKLQQAGKIPDVPIYIDSPMATKVTGITLASKDEYDEETRALTEFQGDRLFAMKNVRFTPTVQESMQINNSDGPKIILSASGMCDAGRILHHLKHNLWRKECTVIIAGYQAEGTLGRQLVDGVKKVKIMGEVIKVEAEITTMNGFSAHADKEQLLSWYGKMSQKPKCFFVTHGEFDAAFTLAHELQIRMGTAVYVPNYGDSVVISGEEYRVEEAKQLEVSPEIEEMHDTMDQIAREYMSFRSRMDHATSRDTARAATVTKKLQKLRKYMNELLNG